MEVLSVKAAPSANVVAALLERILYMPQSVEMKALVHVRSDQFIRGLRK